jgi:hypothetical protein
MMKPVRLAVAVMFLTAIVTGCAQSNETAHKLLEGYMENAVSVQTKADAKLRVLDDLAKEAESNKENLPAVFHQRFMELLEMTKLSIGSTLDADDRKKLSAYIEKITGAPLQEKSPDAFEKQMQALTGKPIPNDVNITIAAAFAFSNEVVRLDMLLDGETDPEKVRKKYAEKIQAKRK